MALTSIILPVYNCAANLDKGLAALKPFLENAGIPCEIIVVDDGSADQRQAAAIAQKHQCNFIAHPVNRGKGAAVKNGVLAAKGDMIIFMDGDFPFHLSAISSMIDTLQSGSAQVVIGDRTLQQSTYPDNINSYRKAGSKILSTIISKFYLPGFRDTQCGIKGFAAEAGKKIFRNVTLQRFSFDVEILFIARRNGYAISRIPVQVYEQSGTSVKVFKDGFYMLASLYAIFFNNIIGKYRIK
jgi:dolichyl-phosphate beta-glucosyltransferase